MSLVKCSGCGKKCMVAKAHLNIGEAEGVICPYCDEEIFIDGAKEANLPCREQWAIERYWDDVIGSPMSARKPKISQMRKALVYGDEAGWLHGFHPEKQDWEFEGRMDRMNFALYTVNPSSLKKNKQPPVLLGETDAASYKNLIESFDNDSEGLKASQGKELEKLGFFMPERTFKSGLDAEFYLGQVYKRAELALEDYFTLIPGTMSIKTPSRLKIVKALVYGDQKDWGKDWETKWEDTTVQCFERMEKALLHVDPSLSKHSSQSNRTSSPSQKTVNSQGNGCLVIAALPFVCYLLFYINRILEFLA